MRPHAALPTRARAWVAAAIMNQHSLVVLLACLAERVLFRFAQAIFVLISYALRSFPLLLLRKLLQNKKILMSVIEGIWRLLFVVKADILYTQSFNQRTYMLSRSSSSG
jgi:hypothetical protein